MEPEEVRFAIEVREGLDETVVAPQGELDMATVAELRDALAAVDGRLALDLSGLRFVDTSGLRLVLELSERARREERAFAVLPGGASVQRLFEVAGVTGLVPFRDAPDRGTS